MKPIRTMLLGIALILLGLWAAYVGGQGNMGILQVVGFYSPMLGVVLCLIGFFDPRE